MAAAYNNILYNYTNIHNHDQVDIVSVNDDICVGICVGV